MPDTYAAAPRSTLGKRVAALRRDGVLPANIYGRGQESVAVQVATRDARRLLQAHGLNTLVEIRVDGEATARPVVVRGVQRHPVSHELQHVDFYQVDLERKMQAHVPVVVVGEAPAVHTYKALLLHGADSVLVEALPAQMPTHFEVSVAGLAELDSTVTVADLARLDGVEVLSPPELVLAHVTRQRVVAAETAAVPEGEQPAAAAEAAEES